jgi:hypothetical protein
MGCPNDKEGEAMKVTREDMDIVEIYTDSDGDLVLKKSSEEEATAFMKNPPEDMLSHAYKYITHSAEYYATRPLVNSDKLWGVLMVCR